VVSVVSAVTKSGWFRQCGGAVTPVNINGLKVGAERSGGPWSPTGLYSYGIKYQKAREFRIKIEQFMYVKQGFPETLFSSWMDARLLRNTSRQATKGDK
jgi:hypothetical protein